MAASPGPRGCVDVTSSRVRVGTPSTLPPEAGGSLHDSAINAPAGPRQIVQHPSRIQLLNSFRCDFNGARLKLPHSTARVLALLCLDARPVQRSYVCQLLWPQQRPDLASGSLRTAVWRLRRACPGLVTADEHQLALRAGLSVDYRELVDSVERVMNLKSLETSWNRTSR